MYEDAFETKFLKATEALYHEEGNRYMQETDVSYDILCITLGICMGSICNDPEKLYM